jgi:hypothetical protein
VATKGNFFISASPAAMIGDCQPMPDWDGLDYNNIWACQRSWDLVGKRGFPVTAGAGAAGAAGGVTRFG